jgi:hypothetical protein
VRKGKLEGCRVRRSSFRRDTASPQKPSGRQRTSTAPGGSPECTSCLSSSLAVPTLLWTRRTLMWRWSSTIPSAPATLLRPPPLPLAPNLPGVHPPLPASTSTPSSVALLALQFQQPAEPPSCRFWTPTSPTTNGTAVHTKLLRSHDLFHLLQILPASTSVSPGLVGQAARNPTPATRQRRCPSTCALPLSRTFLLLRMLGGKVQAMLQRERGTAMIKVMVGGDLMERRGVGGAGECSTKSIQTNNNLPRAKTHSTPYTNICLTSYV